MSAKKYRPYFTLPQLQRIYNLAASVCSGPIDVEIMEATHLFLLKASTGLTSPAFSPVSSNLGMPTDEEDAVKSSTLSALMLGSPTPTQGDTEEFRFNNKLMSPEEEAEYSKKLMSLFGAQDS